MSRAHMVARAVDGAVARMTEERGQDLSEYGLLTMLIALALALAVSLSGTSLHDLWLAIGAELAKWL